MDPESVTLWIAIWGAVLGTASFIWNIYRAVTDRGALRVNCRIARFAIIPVSFLTEDRPMEPQLAYTITNVGRRPIFVTQVGGAYKDGTYFETVPRTRPWPKELKPGDRIDERAEDPVKVILDRAGVKFLGAWDSTGRLYKVSTRNLRKLRAEAKRLQSIERGDGPEEKTA